MIFKALGIFLLILVVNAKPADDETISRKHQKKLSEQEHFVNEEHNPDYDHEAFLGDEAEEFDNLSPEESRDRLSLIVDRIDADKDDKITTEELKQWIEYTQKKYITNDVKRQWENHNPKNKESISWEEYKGNTYNFLENEGGEEDSEDIKTYQQMMSRDERRWKLADVDGDEKLTFSEFHDFLHPEESKHMKNIVVVETMEDIDLDKDGKVSVDEYIGDMYRGSDGDPEPIWVNSEREQFSQFRDKDNDGFMDETEVRDWIIPPNYDHALAEAKHLITEADEDRDGFLSKEEILDKSDVFVGSQATDFGEALNTIHDEF